MEHRGMRYTEHMYHGCSSEPAENMEFDSDVSTRGNTEGSHDCLQFNGKKYEDLSMEDMEGVEFSSVQEVESFYAIYSLAIGFSVRKEKLDKNKKLIVVRRMLVCSKEGHRRETKTDDEVLPDCSLMGENSKIRSNKKNGNPFCSKQKKTGHSQPATLSSTKEGPSPTHNTTRTGCLARLTVRRSPNGTYRVVDFITEHNHALFTSELTPFLRSHRKVKDHDLATVSALRKVSVKTCRAYEFLVHQAGGFEFVGFLIKDLHNKVDSEKRELMIDGDGHAAISFMNFKASREPEFYCLFSVDEECRLANMFWRDSQSLADYNAFGDVLILDSTYKTNIYGKPLAVFAGVNCHRGTVLFGLALLVDETEETYKWVVSAFLSSMKGKKPISVITDGDEAMRNAVTNLIPEARHRLCAWHISKNVIKNVGDPGVQRDFCHLIYAGLSVQAWESAWHYMVLMNGLQNNSWVIGMYNKRDRWAEAFFRDHFFGGVCSTQRCESMNRNLKGGVGRYMRLCEVLPRMDKTLERIRFNGLHDDFKSINSSPIIGSHMQCIQEQVGSICTHDIFLLIKDQIMFESKFLVEDRLPFENAAATRFVVTQYGKPERCWHVTVDHCANVPDFRCSCQLFESDGIPCCHIFTVMKSLQITNFPASLVNKRWKKSSSPSKRSLLRSSGSMHPKDLQVARYGNMMSNCAEICYASSFTDEAYDEISDVLGRLKIRSRVFRTSIDENPVSSVDGLHRNVIRDPNICRTKGAPSNKATPTNDVVVQPGGGKGCGFCSRPGHNRRTCELLKSSKKDTCSGTGDVDMNPSGPSSPNHGFQPSEGPGNESQISGSDLRFRNYGSYSHANYDNEPFLSETNSQHVLHHVEEARTFDFLSGQNNMRPSMSAQTSHGSGYLFS